MNLADMTIGELEKALSVPPYKAKQIYKWIRRGETDPYKMTDQSIALREKMKNEYNITWPKVYKKFASSLDETVKYLIELSDGNIVETVLMSYEHGYSICISTPGRLPNGVQVLRLHDGRPYKKPDAFGDRGSGKGSVR